MNRELLQQRINDYLSGGGLFNPEMANHEAVRDLLIDCRAELAKPEQEPDLPPVFIGVDVTHEGTHVNAFYRRPNAVAEMFYSEFHPLAKPDVTLTDEGKTEQEPVEHAIIAGVLFDFMGWLTSRQERLVLSASDEASPAVEAIQEFATMRGLSLDDAKVKDWQDMTAPPRKEWVGLTDDEMHKIVDLYTSDEAGPEELMDFVRTVRAVQAKLKEKNHD